MRSYSAGNLAAAEAASAYVDMLVCSVHHGLDTLYIGLPCAVGAPVGVADLDPKGDILIAKLTLCHLCCTSLLILDKMNSSFIIAERQEKIKNFFNNVIFSAFS